MIRFASILLSFLILLPSFLKVAVLSHYVIEYERYVTELCENRDSPELACNGKCQVMKELKATEHSSPVAPVLPQIKLQEQPACEHEQSRLLFFPTQHQTIGLTALVSKLLNGNPGSVFHPPC